MDPTLHAAIQITLLILQLFATVYVLFGNPYTRNMIKWHVYRAKTHTVLVSRDSDWREWLEVQLGQEGKHWKAEEDLSSFYLFKHNLSKITITIKRRYNPYIMQFRLMYEIHKS